jgi:very-short-patch-repair endonuclease
VQPKPDAIEFARQLRQSDNDAEALMWLELKAKQLGGFKFVRHFPIGPYFADFLCRSESLVVEIDGNQHSESAQDARRDQYMAAEGYSIMRFWNTDVFKERTAVCETILAALQGRIEGPVNSDYRFIPRTKNPKPPHRRLRRHLSPEGRGVGAADGEGVVERRGAQNFRRTGEVLSCAQTSRTCTQSDHPLIVTASPRHFSPNFVRGEEKRSWVKSIPVRAVIPGRRSRARNPELRP